MHRHRQLHLWITEHDYTTLRDLARARDETLSSVIRRLIKLHRIGPVCDSRDAQPLTSEAGAEHWL
jgi:hypothetical protein